MFKDKTFIISLVIVFQYWGLVLIFSFWPSQMASEAKQVILQSYVVAFSAIVGYWLGKLEQTLKEK